VASQNVDEAVAGVRAWGEARDWRGYDPYDGLNSPLAPVLSLGIPLGRRFVTQAVKLSPINLRPVLGIRPTWNQKAIALVASGYARLAVARHDDTAAAQAGRWLSWLVDNCADGPGTAWGYHFPVQTRVFRYPRNVPNTIATSFAAHALLDGVELLGGNRWGEPVEAAAAFLVEQMLVDDPSRPYFRYLIGEDELVHNANALACSVLARAGRALDRPSLLETAENALRVTLEAQRPDGAWPYADAPGHDWVDNYHTGYVIESLARCGELAPDERLERGVSYWQRALFLADGTPKYYDDRTLPLDAHNYAQAVETWLALVDRRGEALARAEGAARLLIERMVDPAGYVHFQQWRYLRNRVPLIRWTTAPSFRALAGLLLARVLAADETREEGRFASGSTLRTRPT
jgi:hypothetical protein